MRRFHSPNILLFEMVLALALGFANSAHAASVTIRDAVEAAWSRQPERRALAARQDELAAKRNAANSLFAGSPSVELAQRTDRLNRNQGDRETEALFTAPIWSPGTQAATKRLVDAETSTLDSRNLATKLKIAGEVREAYWQARFAQNELEQAKRKAKEAAVLMQDVERRFKAGDLARTDLNQAQGTERLARANVADAQARLQRAQRLFFTLTGLQQLPETTEQIADALATAGSHHPQLAAMQAAVAIQRARLAQVSVDRRDPLEVSVGMRRERPAFGTDYENSLLVGVRIPLASQPRNAPRIATANAELIEAETALALEQDRIRAEIDSAEGELMQAQAVESLAQERQQLAADTQNLHAKAFQLGQLDLPTRLRSENERFDAELSHSRARLEVSRAISRLNQALGMLP